MIMKSVLSDRSIYFLFQIIFDLYFIFEMFLLQTSLFIFPWLTFSSFGDNIITLT